MNAFLVCRREHSAHQSGYSVRDQEPAGWSCLPSWRATCLRGTSIMKSGCVPSLLAHMAFKSLCTSLGRSRRHRAYGQVILRQVNSPQACHICPAGGQWACMAPTPCCNSHPQSQCPHGFQVVDAHVWVAVEDAMLTNQIGMGQSKILQACHISPAGGQ